jgi:hypothetical protein
LWSIAPVRDRAEQTCEGVERAQLHCSGNAFDGNARLAICRRTQIVVARVELRGRFASGTLQRTQHRGGTFAQGDGFGAAKQHLHLTVETKRTKDVGRGCKRIDR